MTQTDINPTEAREPIAAEHRTLWKVGVASGLIGAVATALTAAVARAADVTLKVKGEPIPIAGFAVLTFIGAMLGLGLATLLSRRARQPQRSFVLTTVILTALSIMPDAFADTDTASRIVLAVTHLLAAAIIVPSIASRLRRISQ
jgi:peptidoglycan/LPS O-acetylase OafA/YrhL